MLGVRGIKMKINERIKMLVGTALLTAIVVVLQFLSGYIKFGPFSITLALIPIAIGAILYGPLSGMWLGMTLGAVILFTGGGEPFFSFKPFITIVLCLAKTGIAGLVSGFVYRIIARKHVNLGIIAAALVVPIINTGLFLSIALTVFNSMVSSWAPEGESVYVYAITSLVGLNFVIEFAVSILLSSTIVYIINVIKNTNHNHSGKISIVDNE